MKRPRLLVHAFSDEDRTPTGGALSDASPAPGTLLVAPADASPRAADVLCVFDHDADAPGALYALILNRPTDEPAQRVAFGLPIHDEERLWWGGPTADAFALVELRVPAVARHRLRPESAEPRPFVTERTAVFFPGRDHPPADQDVARTRVFRGSVWLDPHEQRLYAEHGSIMSARDEPIFDTSGHARGSSAVTGTREMTQRRSKRRDFPAGERSETRRRVASLATMSSMREEPLIVEDPDMFLTWVKRTPAIPDEASAATYLREHYEIHHEIRGLVFLRRDDYEAKMQGEDDWWWKCSEGEPGAEPFWEAAYGPALES